MAAAIQTTHRPEGEGCVRKGGKHDGRPDQQKFRREIVDRDGLRCVISGCERPDVLDAAHLNRHAGDGSSDLNNGMILSSRHPSLS